MDLASAKSELRNPPSVNVGMFIVDTVAVVFVAFLMFLVFG